MPCDRRWPRISSLSLTPASFPRTSLPALALVAAAYRQSDRMGEAVSLALRDSLFERGRDISRQDVPCQRGHRTWCG